MSDTVSSSTPPLSPEAVSRVTTGIFHDPLGEDGIPKTEVTTAAIHGPRSFRKDDGPTPDRRRQSVEEVLGDLKELQANKKFAEVWATSSKRTPFGLKLGPMSDQVTSVSVPQGVAEYVKGLIHRGELGPGDRLPPERQLAESLGVARVSLREAFKQLQEEGYIVARRGKSGGNFVTALSQPLAEWRRNMLEREDELDDLTTMRVAVECHAASLAASRRTSADLEAMLAAIHQQAAATNHTEFRLADASFHDAVAKAAGSKRLENAVRHARSELFSPADMLDHPDPMEDDQLQHKLVFEAIRDGDPSRAHQAMQDHIEHTRQEIRRVIESGRK